MTASVHGCPWFVLTRLGVVHAKGPFVWIEALSGPEWDLEICAAQHEKRSDVFCDFNVFQCLQNYPTTHEAWSQTWQLVTASYHMMAFWIEVIWVVDSFQLLHGIPFRWRPSIEFGPRGGTGWALWVPWCWALSHIGNMMQYVTITSSPWFVVDALEMFPNLLRLKKNRLSLSRVANRLWERQLWWWCLGWNASPWQLGAEWEPCPDFLELGKR